MSKTWNTAPYAVQKKRLLARGERWRFAGYPATVGGCQGPLRHEWANRFERRLRQRVRADLFHGRETPQRYLLRIRWYIM